MNLTVIQKQLIRALFVIRSFAPISFFPRDQTLSQCHSEAQPKNLVFVTP